MLTMNRPWKFLLLLSILPFPLGAAATGHSAAAGLHGAWSGLPIKSRPDDAAWAGSVLRGAGRR